MAAWARIRQGCQLERDAPGRVQKSVIFLFCPIFVFFQTRVFTRTLAHSLPARPALRARKCSPGPPAVRHHAHPTPPTPHPQPPCSPIHLPKPQPPANSPSLTPGAALLCALAATPAAPPERIAIVGGGLAGLATAYHLLDAGSAPLRAVHVYDPCPPGCGGASAVAAGLLHPFTPRGREIWRGRDGFEASRALLARCAAASQDGGGDFCASSGLLRLALDDAQEELLRGVTAAAGGAYDEAMEQHWRSVAEAVSQAGSAVGASARGASFAPAALSVDTPAYLRALWRLCQAIAAEGGGGGDGGGGVEVRWCERGVASLAELQAHAVDEGGGAYDAIVVAMGSRAAEVCRACAPTPRLTWNPKTNSDPHPNPAQVHELRALSALLKPCRGQNLLLRNDAGLTTPLICGKCARPPPTAVYHPCSLPPLLSTSHQVHCAPARRRGGRGGKQQTAARGRHL